MDKIDFQTYASTVNQSIQATGSMPSAWHYFSVIFTDNLSSIILLIVTMTFAILGLFVLNPEHKDQVNWALHAAELSLGVFLGLLKKS